MKKMIATLALAGLSTLAFAQDVPVLKFSGYFDSGFALHANGKDPAPFGLWGNDAGKNGGRFNLDGTYGTDVAGLKFEFRSETWNTSTAPVLKFGYVYANLFDKLVTVNAGIVKDATWNTTGDAAYKPVDSEPGVQLIVKPVAGLTVGTFVNVAYAGGAATARTAGAPYAQDTGFDVVASYSMDKVFTAVAGLKSYPVTLAKYTAPADTDSTKDGIQEYYLGLGFAGVPNLTAALELKGTNVNDYAYSGRTEIVQTLKYNLKDFGAEPATVGLIAYEWTYGDDAVSGAAFGAKPLDLSFKVNPWASYKVEAATFKLGASYLAGHETTVTAVADSKFTVAGQAAAGFEAGSTEDKLALLQVKPEVSYAVSPALTVTAFYAYTASAGKDDVYFLVPATEKTSLSTFAVEFLYKF